MKRALLALFVLLAACAPAPTTAPEATLRVEGPVGFYPARAGLEWVYLPQGDRLDDPPYRLQVLGPTAWNGVNAVQYRFSGRGQERLYYRQVSADGVRLLGFEEVISASRVTFDPPLLEYPPQALLEVGYRWGGRTRVRSVFVLPSGVEEQARFDLEYTFTVIGKGEVRVPAGVFEAYMIRFSGRSSDGETSEYEAWFVPHLGEVRTREGLLLVRRNF
ncbi:hypothetical protein [Marinithermus hydrothermalis]|uniref:Lipoprotein n=1 Tax=Marinithermus hydrothermalis (strain DSM 14884 / JCM 11576 / T1) TaxID=869210 RepID=F2NN34_MARHT|nr:hypothetical protein [Marinithermus hydrothermalis]AEB12773.1 hypothetical protein Marky_2047 [Marinithermus hydrothermalis DSM 14884]